MGRLSAGIGLISGIDIQTLVSQLIAIEARPRDQLVQRIGTIDAQRTAYMDVSARITALIGQINALSTRSAFEASTARSSDEDVLGVTVGAGARPGSYSFIVRSLASTQQLVSQGFRARDAAVPAGTLRIESARARVNPDTRLSELNGGRGVQGGSIRLTDASNREATIRVTDAITLNEVVRRINSAGINVRAALRDDSIVLTETTGGELRVGEMSGGRTASDLGFSEGSYSGSVTGRPLIALSLETAIDRLNDGLGVRRGRAGGDFLIRLADQTEIRVDLSGVLSSETRLERLNHGAGIGLGRIRITDDQQHATDVDLTGATTVGQIKSRIEAAVDDVTVTITGSRIIVAYRDNRARRLQIEDVSGTAARDLGIAATSDTGRISGREVLKIDSLADIVAGINYAANNTGQVSATVERDHIVLTAGQDFSLAVLNASAALTDLGLSEGDYAAGPLHGQRIVGGVNSVLLRTLNGGRGYSMGTIRIQANGQAADVDLSGARTLQQVIDAIAQASQQSNLRIEAGYDATRTRIQITNTAGSGDIVITDLSGDFAAQTGLDRPASRVVSNDLQRRYISETTLLSDLNAGRGVAPGKLRIRNSAGQSYRVDLTGSLRTLDDVIREINDQARGVRARINDTGDGLLIEDTAGGSGPLKIEEDGGTTAADLNIRGESATGRIDGSFELRLDIRAGETLEDVVRRINEKTTLASATILQDGNPVTPYRLSITAARTGLAGELIIDGGSTLNLSTISAAQDATVILGNSIDGGMVFTGSSNTFSDIVPGLTVHLNSVSDDPVTVNVSSQTSDVAGRMDEIVRALNDALERIDTLGSYDADTESRGILLGEGAIRAIETRLRRLISDPLPGSGAIRRLAQIGGHFRGGQVELDQARFTQALEETPEAVIDFFTNPTTGLAKVWNDQLEAITDEDGLIGRRGQALEDQKEELQNRITRLNELLERKRDRLLRQFQVMEETLARLQSQQNTLAGLGTLPAFGPPGGTRR